MLNPFERRYGGWLGRGGATRFGRTEPFLTNFSPSLVPLSPAPETSPPPIPDAPPPAPGSAGGGPVAAGAVVLASRLCFFLRGGLMGSGEPLPTAAAPEAGGVSTVDEGGPLDALEGVAVEWTVICLPLAR